MTVAAPRRAGSRACLRVLLAALFVLNCLPAFAGERIFEADFDEPGEGPYSAGDASRFLAQASFGATPAEISRLESLGFNAWLTEQTALPATLHRPYAQWIDDQNGSNDGIGQAERLESFGKHAITAPDQLRQRVAYALAQVLVVSDWNGSLGGEPYALLHYYDMLIQGAFGNYRTLLENVTKSPIMGVYLSHLRNRRPDAALNIRPDENYAREIMQLFSVGLVMLNPDGTPVDGDPGTPGVQTVPTYNQGTISGFAHVFTGWIWFNCPANEFEWCGPGDPAVGWFSPMVANENYHASAGTKQLLNYPGVSLPGGVLAAGGNANSDLQAALNNIFNHPNVGPFLSRLLIQRLTTSNPSPGYVQRVAAVFADSNGAQSGGVRGDLGAVVRAILLDVEARRPSQAPAEFGKLREPQLRMTQLWRAFDARTDNNRHDDWRIRYPYYFQSQAVLESPTVFNFYLPGYSLPGEVAQAGLDSPEFQIFTDTYVTRLSNELSGFPYWSFRGNTDLDPEVLKIDIAPYYTLADNPHALLDRFDTLLMGGRMSMPMYNTLLAHLQSINFSDVAERRRLRVQDLIWLISVSPEYVIER
jgi:uncharacterized protein (DUF1800 family)